MSVRARAVIVDDQGRVLLDRTGAREREPFFWLPGGGVEPGETSEEALRRELVEEAALRDRRRAAGVRQREPVRRVAATTATR